MCRVLSLSEGELFVWYDIVEDPTSTFVEGETILYLRNSNNNILIVEDSGTEEVGRFIDRSVAEIIKVKCTVF